MQAQQLKWQPPRTESMGTWESTCTFSFCFHSRRGTNICRNQKKGKKKTNNTNGSERFLRLPARALVWVWSLDGPVVGAGVGGALVLLALGSVARESAGPKTTTT